MKTILYCLAVFLAFSTTAQENSLQERQKRNKDCVQAVKNGQKEFVRKLLEKGVDIETTSPDGFVEANSEYFDYAGLIEQSGRSVEYTLLMIAVKRGYTEIAQMLIDYGADINARHKFEGPPVMIAAKYDQFKTLSMLKEHGGVDIQARHLVMVIAERGAIIRFYLTPLMTASLYGGIQTVQILLRRYKADPRVNLVYRAPFYNSAEAFDIYNELSLKEAEDAVDSFNSSSRREGERLNRYTAFNLAIESGNIEIARLLAQSDDVYTSQLNLSFWREYSAKYYARIRKEIIPLLKGGSELSCKSILGSFILLKKI